MINKDTCNNYNHKTQWQVETERVSLTQYQTIMIKIIYEHGYIGYIVYVRYMNI